MKLNTGVLLAIIAGIVIGFFGVLVSVFSDGALAERLVAIVVILLVYYVLGGVWGLVRPGYSWKWGLLLGAPGVLFLGVFMIREFNAYYFIYMVLIVTMACFGAWAGSAVRSRRKK